MLSDEVVEFAEWVKPPSGRLEEGQAKAYSALAQEITEAQRYALSREAVFLIHSVSEMTAPKVLAALKICRMPFPSMWVEFVFRDRQDYFQTLGCHDEIPDGTSAPSRLGFLLQQLDDTGRQIEVTLVWNHRSDAGPTIGALALAINMSDDVSIDPAAVTLLHEALSERAAELPRELRDPKHRDQWLEVESRMNPSMCRFMLPTWRRIIAKGKAETTAALADAGYDIKAEWKFVIGLLLVLNSRNVVEPSEEHTFEKLNKARTRNHKIPLLSYRNLRLSLSHVQRNRMGKPGIADLMKHLVSGHWKVRRTGIFWWSPHVRGNRGEVVNRTRIVKG